MRKERSNDSIEVYIGKVFYEEIQVDMKQYKYREVKVTGIYPHFILTEDKYGIRRCYTKNGLWMDLIERSALYMERMIV